MKPFLATLVLALLAACGGRPSAGQPRIVLPVQPPADEPRAVMEALLTGMLVEEDGCLRVAPEEGGAAYLPVWPHGWSVREEADGGLVLLDAAGSARLRVGERVRLSGGEAPPGEAEHGACAGPYWIVGGEAGPAGG